ncbi:MAG: hypothetical protein LBU32_31185 [Clostridiales bacterium]|nr:hypothetical protein [Clostridiales bacterium]
MAYIDLAGNWKLEDRQTGQTHPGCVPGCSYLDLIEAKAIPDPFWGLNEESAKAVGEKDFVYSRSFTLEKSVISSDSAVLAVSGLDTIACIKLNGEQVASCSNAFISWRFNVKRFLREGDNLLEIEFTSPLPYLRKKNKEKKLFALSFGCPPAYLRKPQCHYGWDWGPNLPPAGITGSIGLEFKDSARLSDVKIKQRHLDGIVEITIETGIEIFAKTEDLSVSAIIKAPDGAVQQAEAQAGGMLSIKIQSPLLWWCNGLGEQPLYEVEVNLASGDRVLDSWSRRIGLRRIRLDSSEDGQGRRMQFIINGAAIFAKGADWIPSDSFVSRTSKDNLRFYIESAKRANMNMLRVWGGGYYESDDFYDLCDEMGILVWQDCAFACCEYPLDDPEYMENVRQEIISNASRLRHHASLALWCGNNELEFMYMLFMKKGSIARHKKFFFEVLRDWIASVDGEAPYWPGSPSSGDPSVKVSLVGRGDSHLWQVWHGMKPIEAYEELPARFCSEFGLESMPSMKAVRSFTDAENPDIRDPVMKLHQKSKLGNEKMLYYILSKYRYPSNFEDFSYLSQLIQSEAMRMAVEGWRRQTGVSGGALYWQYNDCWPTASWSSIDYLKQYKALQYRARHFNSMVCVTAKMSRKSASIYVINDLPQVFQGVFSWRVLDFSGDIASSGRQEIKIGSMQASIVLTLDFKAASKGKDLRSLALILEVFDDSENLVSSQSNLLVPDKKALLEKPKIGAKLALDGDTAIISLSSDTYARYAYIEIDGVVAPLSDNFFDMEPGRSYEVEAPAPEGSSARTLEKSIRIKSLADVSYKGTEFTDSLRRLSFMLNPTNLFSWVIFNLI